jgi:hypothetical protein
VYGNEKEEKKKEDAGSVHNFFSFFFLSKKQTNNWRGFLVDWKYTLPFFPDFGRGAGGWE